jgi:multicomponent Na+:H+ antiporter subunit F
VTLQNLALVVAIPALALAAVLAAVRVLLGPSLPDRVVALDLLGAIGIGIVCAYTLATGEPVFIDVALAMAIIGFLGSVAFARYIERGVR